MTRLISILFLSSILIQSFSRIFILVEYELNKEYITNIFCENKSEPQLQCNGKCHLMKQLKAEDEKENMPLNKIKVKSDVLLFCSLDEFLSINTFIIDKLNFPAFQAQKTVSRSYTVFRPPTC